MEIPALHCTRAWTARRTPNPGGLILPSDSQPSVRCGSCAEYLGAPLVGCWECGSANAVSMTLKLAHLYVGLFRWSTGKHMPGGEPAPKGGYLGAALHTGLEALGETPNPEADPTQRQSAKCQVW